jgi:hypothetical protein
MKVVYRHYFRAVGRSMIDHSIDHSIDRIIDADRR